MPFLEGVDTRNTKEIGQGQVATGFNRDVYFLDDTAISNYDPADPASAWVRIKFVEEFVANTEESEIVVYDGRDTDHTIEGRKESTLSVKQNYVSYHESIEKLKNKQIFYAECLGDDRDPEDANGKKLYSEMRIYNGKLAKYSYDKPTDGTYNVSGEGKFQTSTTKIVFRKLTPMSATVTASGGNTASTGVAKTLAVAATDLYGASVDLLAANNQEIQGVTIVKVSGTPTMVQGGTNAAPTVTFTGTGAVSIKAVITTKNNVVTETAPISITVS